MEHGIGDDHGGHVQWATAFNNGGAQLTWGDRTGAVTT